MKVVVQPEICLDLKSLGGKGNYFLVFNSFLILKSILTNISEFQLNLCHSTSYS